MILDRRWKFTWLRFYCPSPTPPTIWNTTLVSWLNPAADSVICFFLSDQLTDFRFFFFLPRALKKNLSPHTHTHTISSSISGEPYKEVHCVSAPHQHYNLAWERWGEGGQEDTERDGQARDDSHLQQHFRFFSGYWCELGKKRTGASAPVWTLHQGWILENRIRSDSLTMLTVSYL